MDATKTKSILLSWTISYLVILMIPIAISAAIFVESKRLLETEVNRSNQVLLKQVQQAIDSQLNDIRRIGVQMSINGKLTSFISNAATPDSFWRFSALNLIENFTVTRISNSLIRDFYIYIKNADMGLSSYSLIDSDLLYKMYHENTGLSKADWKQLLDRSYNGEFFKMNVSGLSQTSEETIVFAQTLPIQRLEDRSATLLVFLNRDRFQQSIANVRLEEESTVFIVNKDNRILFSTRPNIDPSAIQSNLWQSSDRTETGRWNGESVTISHISSEAADWQYVSILPTRLYAKKVTTIRNITIGGLLFGIILGGVAALWFTRRNYRPIGKIMDIVSQKVKWNLEHSKNELNILQTVLTKTLEEQDRSVSKLKEQQMTIRANFLGRLLKGRVQSGPDLNPIMESYGIRFETGTFAVLALHIEDYRELFRTNETEDTEKKIQFVHLILTNILEELIGSHHLAYFAEVDGLIVCLVNTKGFADEAMQQLIDSVQEAQRFIHSKFYFYFSVGISDIHSGMAGIPAGYQEAMEALEYKLIMGTGKIISFDEIKRPKEDLYYPLELERQLINHIASGDFTKSTEVVNELLMTNFSGGTLSIELAKCLMFELIGTMMKALEQIKLDSQGVTLHRTDLTKRLFRCETFEEIESEMILILESVCDFIQQRKRSRNFGLKDQIIIYIHEHYSDVNLGLSNISEHYGVHPTYVSKFFKEQTGINVIDYINQYRIDLAKKLLVSEDGTVQKVSEQVGFLNSNSFIRVFKKYEGITPGNYKQNIQSDEVK